MRTVALVLAAVVSLAGCSDGRGPAPTSPTSPPVSPAAPATSLTRVWLCCGSNQVSINSERKVEVRATYADGSTRDVTNVATSWRSSNPAVAAVSDKGIVRGLAEGTVNITASYEGLAATWDMYVWVDPFRVAGAGEITGFIRELTANGETYIPRAEVEVSGGASNGRKVVTDISGFFRISGLQAPGFDLVVSEAGYSVKRIRVTELGRDLSGETIMTPASTMVSAVLEGPVCNPTRSISSTFTPEVSAFIRITSSRYSSTRREVFENGALVNSFLSDNTDMPVRAGARYELRVTGNCDYGASDVRLTYLRPR